MSRQLRVAAAMAALLLLASAAAAMAGADRPWAGHAAGQTWFDLANPKGCEAGITTRTEEPAIATHFGAAFLILSHCPTGDNADNFHDADFALYGANGDAVYGHYVGTIDVYTEVVGEEMLFTIYLTITDGDGRFEDATGSAVMKGGAVFEGWDDLSWAWWASWAGTLDY
ncbi:MAG: hypothetical protein ACM3JP_01090 [Betaproteobacteria bacterium]